MKSLTLIDITSLILLTLVQAGLSILSYKEFIAGNYGWSSGYFLAVAGVNYLLIDFVADATKTRYRKENRRW